MKIGFIVPRFGAHVVGGAEFAARAFAERLALVDGTSCEVFTTCALDAATWRDETEPGTTVESGVTVHRFASVHGRSDEFAQWNERLHADAASLDAEGAMRWLEALGPVCPDAVDAAAASACDVVTVHPYLYHPCVTGVARLGPRSVLHPAAHDEPAIHLPIYAQQFRSAGGLAFWTDQERHTAVRLFPDIATHPQTVVGFGVETMERTQDTAPEHRYVLCLGKVLSEKGCVALARWFIAYKQRRGVDDLQLVFAGPVHDALPAHPDIVVLGTVDEATKVALLRDALALISPSPNESLSLVVLEAWAASTAVIVNGACDVTRAHCERSGGGLWFVDYGTFEAVLDRCVRDPDLVAALGRAGRRYVEREYTWPAVIRRYLAFLQSIAARAA